MPVIELRQVSKWFGEVIGLNHVTTSIGGGITGLVGPNGAGKSTLMGLVMSQLRPSQGTLSVYGKSPWNRPAVLSKIGYCPEGDPFWSNLTGWQFVHFLARLSGLRPRSARTAALHAIEQTGMTKDMHRAIKGYSKGMRQRIKIAQALAHSPRLLVLDEPFTGADPVSRHELAELFRALAADGVDVLMSSHVLHEVESLTRQILMIDHGRIVAEGDLHAVRERMLDRPHAIRMRVDQPRRLAAHLAEMATINGLRISEDGELVVETSTPDEVYDRVSAFVLEHHLVASEVAAADESLEAVFGYLTDRGAR